MTNIVIAILLILHPEHNISFKVMQWLSFMHYGAEHNEMVIGLRVEKLYGVDRIVGVDALEILHRDSVSVYFNMTERVNGIAHTHLISSLCSMSLADVFAFRRSGHPIWIITCGSRTHPLAVVYYRSGRTDTIALPFIGNLKR